MNVIPNFKPSSIFNSKMSRLKSVGYKIWEEMMQEWADSLKRCNVEKLHQRNMQTWNEYVKRLIDASRRLSCGISYGRRRAYRA